MVEWQYHMVHINMHENVHLPDFRSGMTAAERPSYGVLVDDTARLDVLAKWDIRDVVVPDQSARHPRLDPMKLTQMRSGRPGPDLAWSQSTAARR